MATKKVPIEGWQTGIGVMGEGATTGGITDTQFGGITRDGISGTEWL